MCIRDSSLSLQSLSSPNLHSYGFQFRLFLCKFLQVQDKVRFFAPLCKCPPSGGLVFVFRLVLSRLLDVIFFWLSAGGVGLEFRLCLSSLRVLKVKGVQDVEVVTFESIFWAP